MPPLLVASCVVTTRVFWLVVNPFYHQRTEHIHIRHRFIFDVMNDGVVTMCYVPTTDMLANGLTNPFPVILTSVIVLTSVSTSTPHPVLPPLSSYIYFEEGIVGLCLWSVHCWGKFVGLVMWLALLGSVHCWGSSSAGFMDGIAGGSLWRSRQFGLWVSTLLGEVSFGWCLAGVSPFMLLTPYVLAS